MIVFFVLGVNPLESVSKKKSLHGLVLILDPGHGGKDPGSSGVFGGQKVVEDEYVYDVVKRIRLFAEEKGAVVFQTITDFKTDYHRNWIAQEVFPDVREERFSWDNSVVIAGKRGLRKRVAVANRIMVSHPSKSVVFLAVHFDILPNDRQGVHVVIPKKYEPRIADLLLDSFRELKSEVPVKTSGNGMKSVYVLGFPNRVHEKVLIELGNFENTADNWQIRNYQTRNRYAFRIVKALEEYVGKEKEKRMYQKPR